jgi:hypothetical protein
MSRKSSEARLAPLSFRSNLRACCYKYDVSAKLGEKFYNRPISMRQARTLC